MEASRLIAPFAIAAVVAGTAPAFYAAQSPLPAFSSAATTLTSAASQIGFDDFELPGDFELPDIWTLGGGGSESGGISDVFSNIINLIESFTGGSGLTEAVQEAFSTVITEVLSGTPLPTALVAAGHQIAEAVGGPIGNVIEFGLGQIGTILAIGPAVVNGIQSVAAAVPAAITPVVNAVVAAVTGVLGSLGDPGGLPAAIQTALAGIVAAVSDGVETVKTAVTVAWQGIQDALNGEVTILPAAGSARAAAAVAAPEAPAIADGPDSTPAPAPSTQRSGSRGTKTHGHAKAAASTNDGPSAASSAGGSDRASSGKSSRRAAHTSKDGD